MTVRRNFVLTDPANAALESIYREKYSRSYSQIVSDALVQYAVWQKQDYAEKKIDEYIKHRFQSMESSIRSLLSSINIDTLMILVDVLEGRSADIPEVSYKEHYDHLRQEATIIWNHKRQAKKEV